MSLGSYLGAATYAVFQSKILKFFNSGTGFIKLVCAPWLLLMILVYKQQKYLG